MKKLAKNIVAVVLGYQVRKLCKKNNLKVVAVTGSIGKTSTKLAAAKVLSAGFKVQSQDGNYNDLVSVPLVFFGEKMPSLYNPLAWLAVFWRNQKQLAKPYAYDIVVVELGSDRPGDIRQFGKYLRVEIAIVTAIAPEHMQNFTSLDDVAAEELAVKDYASLVMANQDLCADKYLKTVPQLLTYGLRKPADYGPLIIKGAKAKSEAEQYSLMAAAAVAEKLGIKAADIQKSLAGVKAAPGRMQILLGVNGSTIIDDSYNASPAAVKLALDYLYEIDSPQKIAVLGNMNELGSFSESAHIEIGKYCDPKQLALVITIGPDANKYLAPSASAMGCKVHEFDSPYTAGEYLKPILQKGAAVLVKGSQNGVFAEETVKLLLANPADVNKLVRQSTDWLKIKQKAFKN